MSDEIEDWIGRLRDPGRADNPREQATLEAMQRAIRSWEDEPVDEMGLRRLHARLEQQGHYTRTAPAWQRWQRPVAVAAVIVLGLSVTLEWGLHDPSLKQDVLSPAPEPARTPLQEPQQRAAQAGTSRSRVLKQAEVREQDHAPAPGEIAAFDAHEETLAPAPAPARPSDDFFDSPQSASAPLLDGADLDRQPKAAGRRDEAPSAERLARRLPINRLAEHEGERLAQASVDAMQPIRHVLNLPAAQREQLLRRARDHADIALRTLDGGFEIVLHTAAARETLLQGLPETITRLAWPLQEPVQIEFGAPDE